MFLFAHHVAVELFGKEFSPRTPFEHACAFTVVGLIVATSAYGTWALALKALDRVRAGRRA